MEKIFRGLWGLDGMWENGGAPDELEPSCGLRERGLVVTGQLADSARECTVSNRGLNYPLRQTECGPFLSHCFWFRQIWKIFILFFFFALLIFSVGRLIFASLFSILIKSRLPYVSKVNGVIFALGSAFLKTHALFCDRELLKNGLLRWKQANDFVTVVFGAFFVTVAVV